VAGGFIQQKGYQILAADSLYSQTEVLCSSWRFHTAERSSRYRECTVAEQYEDWSGSIEPPATAQNFDLAAETVTCQCLVPPYLFITLGQCNVNIHILINLLLLDRNEYRPLAQRKFPENSRCLSSIIITVACIPYVVFMGRDEFPVALLSATVPPWHPQIYIVKIIDLTF